MEAKQCANTLVSASIPIITMNIITLILAKFNSTEHDTLYGPQNIPVWHPLYGKPHWRCGWYRRKIILYDKRVIFIIVYRFYCLETKTTYSLLPFFIQRYERHINTTIEEILQRYFCENAPVESLAEEPSPSPWTIRRWIKKFKQRLPHIRQSVEEFLIANEPQYHLIAAWCNSPLAIWNDLIQKANRLPIPNKNLILYGAFSYLEYVAAIQNSFT